MFYAPLAGIREYFVCKEDSKYAPEYLHIHTIKSKHTHTHSNARRHINPIWEQSEGEQPKRDVALALSDMQACMTRNDDRKGDMLSLASHERKANIRQSNKNGGVNVEMEKSFFPSSTNVHE